MAVAAVVGEVHAAWLLAWSVGQLLVERRIGSFGGMTARKKKDRRKEMMGRM